MTSVDTQQQDPMPCIEVIRLVTDYFEDALAEWERIRFEAHIDDCDGCDTYLAQMGATIRITGSLTPEELDPRARERLLEAFRTWKTAPPSRPGLLQRVRKRFK